MSCWLTVVVNFYNMRREAERTLYSLSAEYQRGVSCEDYEVLAIDNGSSDPLDCAMAESFGKNFRYVHVETKSPSPAAALNRSVEGCRTSAVMILIDGARMLSPGVLKGAQRAFRAFDNPFVYTLGMHVGPGLQNETLMAGYDQVTEDEILASIDWRENGYRLFEVSSLAASSRRGFFSELAESNCFSLARREFLRVGGFDERFQTPGGGLGNLDFFNRASTDGGLEPVMLLGEASFHQFHGGVATNVPLKEHPWERFSEEYQDVKGVPYVCSGRTCHFLGQLPPEAMRFLISQRQ
jgi:hypothetical protein